MGLFNHNEAEDAYNQVNGGEKHDGSITHELLAGAAGFEAVHAYEKHREKEGITEHHELGKELLAGFAGAAADKYIEKGVYDHLDKERAKKASQEQAEYLWQQRENA
ncbi:MAG: DUF3759 domain-containing protein [Streptosporangiales bacterium]|nr:DUF3759 domain-containing protein [Streptosporangiales bacterium]